MPREYKDAHPDAPQVLVGDMSRRQGGLLRQAERSGDEASGRGRGGLGHRSHQNGLDVDIYYPRKDGLERAARRPDQVDREAAQELVDRFVNAGAIRVFGRPRRALKGPRKVVTPLVYHDDHLHVRLSPRRVNLPVAG